MINLRANSSQFVRGVGTARGSLGGLNRASGQTRGHLGHLTAQVGLLDARFVALASKGGLAAAGVLAVGVAAAKSLREYGGYTRELQRSFAIQELTTEQQLRMSDAAREVGRSVTASNDQLAESYFFLASAGLDAEQQIAALPAVAQFAQAGNFDLALATDLLTDSQSALGLASDDAAQNLENLTRVSDVLIGANTMANASAQQFAEALTSGVAAQARTVGVELEEVVAVLAVYADQGIKGAEASTQLSIALRDLETKALRNAAAFEQAGIDVHDAEGEFRLIEQIVGDLEHSLTGLSDAARKQQLLDLGFSDKSVKSLTQLLGTSDQIREYRSELERMAGTTERVADNSMTRLDEATNSAGKAWSDLKFEVGNLAEVFASPAVELFAGGLDLAAASARTLLRPAAELLRDLEEMASLGFDKFVANVDLMKDSLAELFDLDSEQFRRNMADLAGVEFVPPEQLAVSGMDFSKHQQELNAIAGTRDGLIDLAQWAAAGQQSFTDVVTAIQSVHAEIDEVSLRQLLLDFANGKVSAEQFREAVTGVSDTEAAFEFTVDLTAAEKIGNTFDQQENAVQEAVRRQQELNNAFQAGSITAEEYERASRAVAEARDKATGGSAATAAALQQELDLLGLNVIERERMAAMLQKGARVDDANRVAGLRRELAIGQELLDQQKALAEQKFGAETVDLAERIGLDLSQVGDLAAGDLKSLGLPDGQVQQLQEIVNLQNQLKQNELQASQKDRADQLADKFADPADDLKKQIDELRELAAIGLIDDGTLARGLKSLEEEFGVKPEKADKPTEDRRDRSAAEVRTGEAFSRVLAAMRQPQKKSEAAKAQETGNKKLDKQLTVLRDLLQVVEENAGELIA